MKRFLALFSLSILLFISSSAFAAASDATDCGGATYSAFSCACNPTSGGTVNSSACSTDGSDPITGQNGILRKVSYIVSSIAGVAAVILIVVGAFQYVTSGGDSQKTTNARNTIVGAVIGLGIIAAAQAIVLFVLSRLN